ncbi:GNAT family N-acetyltransferase [Rhodobacteraceae bacterium]|nr:GNAT family N-acetyltransferase [Paracoccaceae bacterium]
MPPALTTRTATFGDLADILALLRDDVLGANRETTGTASYERAFDDILADPNADIMVAVRSGTVVGCAQVNVLANLSHQATKRAQIEGVRISSDHRGSGLGRKFFVLLEDHCRAKGCGLMQLTTNTSRDATLNFYRDIGFELTHHGLKKLLD